MAEMREPLIPAIGVVTDIRIDTPDVKTFRVVGLDGKKVFDEEQSIRMMHRAMELGVNYFDTAPGYCDTISEIIVGKALKGRRENMYVVTKTCD